MRLQPRSWRNATSALLPVATAAVAAGIFAVDILAPPNVVVAGLYVIVVLMATRFCRPLGVVLVAAGCIGLVVAAYFLSAETGINAAIRIAAIGAAAFLAVEGQRAMEALGQGEKQWQEVFEHNPVMYFMVSPTGTVLSVNTFGAAQLGYTAAELVGQSVLNVFFKEDQTLVKDQLATCVEELGRPHSWEIRKIRKDGTVIWVRENAKAIQRSAADAIVLIACEDITERKRGEQRVAAAYAVTRVLAEADSLAAAAAHILRAVGQNLEWDWGALWSFDREREHEGAPLRCDSLWHSPDIETAEFATATRERGYASGEGRLGQVWRSAKPIWMFDAPTERQFLRAAAAAKAGLHGAVIFPVLLDTESLGVVEFFSRATREPDQEQLATLSAIGSQIGQFIRRQRAEAALRVSEERWRRLFETSAAGMALNRLDGVFTAANPALHRMLGRAEEEIVGHNVLELNHEDERAATAEAYAKYRNGSLTQRHVEKKYLRKNGTPVWLNITTTLVPGTETAAPFLQSVYMDITERVRFEAALRASEERWRAVFENTAVGIVTNNFEHGRYETANEAFQRMTGYTGDELRNLTVLDITPEEDRAATRKRIDKIVAGPRRSYRIEKPYRRKDGGILWADINTFFIPATDSTPAFLAVVAVDITERKQVEAALREAEERFRTLVQFSFDVYWESDAQHRFIRQEFAEGLADAPPPGSEIGKARWEVPHVEPDAEAWRSHRETLDAHLPFRDFEFARPTPDGGKRYVSVSGLPVFDKAGRFIGYRGVGRHITDRRRAEAALRASEERWRAMVETAPVGIISFGSEHRRYVTANKSFQVMTGYTEAELQNLTPLDITHQDDRESLQKHVDQLIAGSLRSYRLEKRYRRKDGEIVWADISSFVLRETDGSPAFLGGVTVDITDRRRAEAALRASEERWRAMFETAPVGIATFDFEHRRYLTANESFQRMTGYTEAELRNLTTLEITHEDDRAAMQERIDSGTVGVLQRKRYRRKDGEVLWADVNSFVVPATDSTPAFRGTVVVDITDRKRAEAALQQSQDDLARLNRVMLLGEMTASIAHEVNQPIAAVITNGNAGLRWLGAPQPEMDEVRQALGRIVRDGTRAGEVIARIRALVRKMPPRRELLAINRAIREVIALTQTEMQRNAVRLQARLAEDLPVVSADRIQLQQVLINLIINAIEAMAGGGDGPRELTIVSGKNDVNDVVVEVQDNGPGLDQQKLDRLFQSFYTTKPDGIGMGLAISRSIAEAHGGRLSAAPNHPRGAVFRLSLPVEEALSRN